MADSVRGFTPEIAGLLTFYTAQIVLPSSMECLQSSVYYGRLVLPRSHCRSYQRQSRYVTLGMVTLVVLGQPYCKRMFLFHNLVYRDLSRQSFRLGTYMSRLVSPGS